MKTVSQSPRALGQPSGCWMSPSVEELLSWSHYRMWRESAALTRTHEGHGLLHRNSGGPWSDFRGLVGSGWEHLSWHYLLLIVVHTRSFNSQKKGEVIYWLCRINDIQVQHYNISTGCFVWINCISTYMVNLFWYFPPLFTPVRVSSRSLVFNQKL